MREGDPQELANELLTLLAPYGLTATGEGPGPRAHAVIGL